MITQPNIRSYSAQHVNLSRSSVRDGINVFFYNRTCLRGCWSCTFDSNFCTSPGLVAAQFIGGPSVHRFACLIVV